MVQQQSNHTVTPILCGDVQWCSASSVSGKLKKKENTGRRCRASLASYAVHQKILRAGHLA